MNDYNFAQGRTASQGSLDMSVDAGLRSFMLGVFNKMALGLLLSAVLAFGATQSPFYEIIFGTPLRLVVMFGPIGILLISAFAMRNPSPMASGVIYWSVVSLIGIGMGALLMAYAARPDGLLIVAKAFLTTSIAFGGLSLWGYTTKRDLSGWGNFLIMGLIGLIVASIVNIFMQSPMMHFVISAVGVLVFAGLTAFDTQRLKHTYYAIGGDARSMAVATNYGALSMYLNFINLFQFILSFMGMGDD